MARKKINSNNGANKKRKASILEEMLKHFIQFTFHSSSPHKLINSKKGKMGSYPIYITLGFCMRWYICTLLCGIIFFAIMTYYGNNIGWSFVVSAGAGATVGKLISDHKRGKSSTNGKK